MHHEIHHDIAYMAYIGHVVGVRFSHPLLNRRVAKIVILPFFMRVLAIFDSLKMSSRDTKITQFAHKMHHEMHHEINSSKYPSIRSSTLCRSSLNVSV